MVEREATIQNAAGIHVRPSGVIMDYVADYEGTITIENSSTRVELNNIMGLLSLGLVQGDTITIGVEGPDEEKTAESLKELFEQHFDFPQKEAK